MEDVKKLWREYDAEHSPEIRDRIIVSYLPLVKYVLGRISLYLPPHLSGEDLTESGVIGLIKAVSEFDLSRNIEFTTFAVPRIRGSILDELRYHDWVPRSARKKASILGEAYRSLLEENNEPPNVKQLAERLGMAQCEVEKMVSETDFASFVSLEGLRGSDDEGHLKMVESIPNERSDNPVDSLANEEEVGVLTHEIGELPEQERIVITLYYYQGLMLKEIAKLLELSKSRVSQIHNSAVKLLNLRIRSTRKRHYAPVGA